MTLSLRLVGILSFVTTCNKRLGRSNRTCILEPVWTSLYAFNCTDLGWHIPREREANADPDGVSKGLRMKNSLIKLVWLAVSLLATPTWHKIGSLHIDGH